MSCAYRHPVPLAVFKHKLHGLDVGMRIRIQLWASFETHINIIRTKKSKQPDDKSMNPSALLVQFINPGPVSRLSLDCRRAFPYLDNIRTGDLSLPCYNLVTVRGCAWKI